VSGFKLSVASGFASPYLSSKEQSPSRVHVYVVELVVPVLVRGPLSRATREGSIWEGLRGVAVVVVMMAM